MIKNRLVLLSVLGLFFFSCKKVDQETAETGNINKLVIPEGFTWESSRDINFEVKITDTRFQSAVHVVSIYDGDPSQGGRLLSKGSGSISDPFTTLIYLANTIKEVFVEKVAPDGTTTIQKVAVGSDPKVSLSLSAVSPKNTTADSGAKISGLDDSPDCNTGCTQTVTTSNTNLNVNNGDVVCVTGNNITIGFNGNGGTVRICGTNVTVQNASLNGSAKLIITRTASVVFSNLNTNGNSSEFTNYGTTTINGSFSPKNIFTNEGTLTTTGDFDLNTSTVFLNNGVINVGATMNVNTSSVATNNGSITTAQHFQLNSQSDFINKCFIWAKGDYNHNSDMFNYGLIKVNNTTTVNGNDILTMYNGAMLSTKDMKLNGQSIGVGTRSLIKVSGVSTLNGGSSVQNSLQYCDANGIETNNTIFSGGATQACNLYIPVTNCNAEGNGTPPPVDTDGDGVLDSQDEYPSDATKAYNNYYPSASLETGATLAFEDQWPKKGDYDMNDLVMNYRYKIVTNAQNKVVQVVGNYNLMAVGGDFKNGFGIEFPVSRSSVTGLTGGTLETGQSKAVVIFFSDMHTQLANYNTKPGEPVSAPKSYTVSFNITNGPLLSTFGLGAYNPFTWNSGIAGGRGYEVHLPGKTPTTLANTALFGTLDDRTNVSQSKYYVTSTGLPWAINVPIKPFKYPIEAAEIGSGYLKFETWATSGGTQFLDWYSNTETGYRNTSKLF
ncbi:LruC domain-containing protein [Daejeonella lutea]|uniref:LruC domain-containing protein n=1 Tax=Daejeonella lutea TaxID=572036 RepID=A0A1T5EEC3_9SPHI|nr:LruC domain-containing protein [Daejeonella lutea]SKB82293.1 LruC domain-containing protein [Daejeonella lutea]